MKILIIDDNADFLEIFSTKLTQAGFQVATAKDGEDGIRQAKLINPDIILLDIEMPGIDGMETLSRFRADPMTSAMRIIFLTNYDATRKETGAIEHIKKSGDLDKVIDEIRRLLKT